MVTAWRLVKAVHASRAFDGEGALKYGGRWNPRGNAVVYLADSLALAALELFVHLDEDDIAEEFRAFPISISDSIPVEIVQPSELPRSWRTEHGQTSTRSRGANWLRKAHSAVLRVPSVIVAPEHNFVLNPAHPDYRRIKIGRAQRFVFDTRMWK